MTLARRFEAVVFDWDGTAVPDRSSDATRVRELVERACAWGMHVAIVSGTSIGNIDRQLRARPVGPGRLVLGLNRGSEVFVVDQRGPQLIERREATPEEEAALSRAAALTVERLAARRLVAETVSQRLNRRKIDLIPLPEWSNPPKARIAALHEAVACRLNEVGIRDLAEVVAMAGDAAREAGVVDARVTSDVKHVEIGLTDKSDSAHWIMRDLWQHGIGPRLVLVAGDEFGRLGGVPGSDSLLLVDEARRSTAASVGVDPGGVPAGVVGLGGGPTAFMEMLADQVARREVLEPPEFEADPRWSLVVDGVDPMRERAQEALLTISDGTVGSSGAMTLDHAAATPLVLLAGVYDGEGAETRLMPGPLWDRLPGRLDDDVPLGRVLDLHTGLLHETIGADAEGGRIVRFVSSSRLGTVALRARRPHGAPPVDRALHAPDAATAVRDAREDPEWMRVDATVGGIVAAAAQRVLACSDGQHIERLGAVIADPRRRPDPVSAVARVAELQGAGFEQLLSEHRIEWANRWEDVDVVVEGDDELQLALRFALFHLMGAAAAVTEAAVGARGVTGSAYRGHVFWDADVFVLPFFAATRPAVARAMLEYRTRRLPEAQAAARALGYEGARFPWESARTGRDVTPTVARDRTGMLMGIHTGQHEEHVVADVAWAAGCYLDWTGDEAFATGSGRALLVETARYWASRVRKDDDGSVHICCVIGPDEYHEAVDDNAFTNVMARWNLRRAAAVAGDSIDAAERRDWLDLADALVDGYDPGTGIYEQFNGFHTLEPLIIEDTAPRRPIAADLLLGRERVAGAQVVKQADVLMLHHLVPDETAPNSLERNLRFYEPRTAHGSSLSPGIHAALFARIGDFPHALEALRIAARIDLDDLTETTSGGLHLAALGSVWQAMAFGFAGLRARGDGTLAIDPNVPPSWSGFALRVRFRGSRVRVCIEHERAEVYADPLVLLRVGAETVPVGPPGVPLRRRHHGWEVET